MQTYQLLHYEVKCQRDMQTHAAVSIVVLGLSGDSNPFERQSKL